MCRFLRLSTYLLAGSLTFGTAWADDNIAEHQTRNLNFGVSGGNINDISKAYCCSGTLGALVKDASGTQYVLSNNHVLARSDQAKPGEIISQPGMIDNGCRAGTTVAYFTVAPKLGSNVDAAVARLEGGTMNATIEDIGQVSTAPANPSIGLLVAKSGRTTGFTTGNIGSINTRVKVQYQRGCGIGKKFTVTYSDQIVINSSTFSAGGDSGSLIVTDDSCHNPVGLLFAGSSTTTIANPIQEVLTKLGTALGTSVGFVGTTCTAGAANTTGPSQTLIDHATSVANEHGPGLMGQGAVIGVGVGRADENPAEAIVVIYIDREVGVVPDLPDQARGVRVKRVFTDPFVAGAAGCCDTCR
ncbi:MAG TPA: hypothetical protein VN442_17020 [Bryobacteraceae bacterium]|nr:hypothetical protein [Bryobacteraceae bacterium]